jgi:hypothetical protein
VEAAGPPPPPPPPAPAPPAGQPSSKRVDVGAVISETFTVYREHAGILLGTAAVVFIFTGIISALLYSTENLVLILASTAVDIVAVTLYTGMVVKLAEDLRDGRRDSTINDLINGAAPAIGALIINGILKGLAVAIGLIALIGPGLWLLTIWAVTAPAIVIERAGAIDAFGRSNQLVKGDGWNVFGVIVVAFLIALGIAIVFSAIGFAIGDAGGIIFRIVGSVLTAPISALVSALLFFHLRGNGAPPPAAQVGAPPAA